MLTFVKYLFCAIGLFSYLEAAQSSDDTTQEIQKQANGFVEAWNTHDPKKMADFWADDASLITPWAKAFQGKDAIEKHFIQEQSDKMKNSTVKITVDNIRLIDSDTAFVDASLTITDMQIADIPAAPLNDHAIFLLVKKDNKWKILIARPY